ncbi:FG-GAP-like repeat-containing protein [Winogradskyella marincola]|uniref:FG-GAP-like repeat-containing protein n=1 Tax=Winogradskyella marincola TaxID=3037795 RepID=A0ABT6G2E9_9FLAO|nr:FG-GAP-like repeat-containing protein [Winogradskyella sp. YYF002]MDG4716216.1 FG-GAP-like repeat-containing protein [Winogradskyella sp. YYF002]
MKNLYFLIFCVASIFYGFAQCNIESSLNENFDDWSGEIDQCWSIISTGAFVYEDTGEIVFYSFNSPNTPTMLATPEIASGTYNLQFDTTSVAGGGLQIEVGTVTDTSNSSTYTTIGSPFTVMNTTTHNVEITINTGEYLVFNAVLPGNHNAISLDNVVLSAVPTDLFSEISTTTSDYWYASSDWADINNDGNLDLVISGGIDTDNDEYADSSKIDFYENVNGTLTLTSQANVADLHLGSVKYLDYDNDGDIDLVTSGQNYNDIYTFYLTVYENENGTFSVSQQLEGVVYSSIETGDYDNDGDLDLLVSGAFQDAGGASLYTRIYENVNGTFSDANAGLSAVQNGNAVFADVDNDSDLDILITGYDINGDNFSALYTNDNGSYTLATLPFTTAESWLALGDYDNDGDLDFAYTGYDDNYDYVTKIYNNDGNGTFIDSGFSLEGVGNFTGNNPIVWGDYDNDGDLDLVFAGTDNNYDDKTYLYTNNQTSFDLASEGLINLGSYANLKFIDLDGDNDLDFAISGGSDVDGYVGRTRFFENNTTVVNSAPNAPSNLVSSANSNNSMTFSWDAATDDFTPSNGLFYMLTVGTTQGGNEIASYPVYGTTWTIENLGNATNYFWSVSAVDTSFVESTEATSETLSINNFETNTFSIFPNPSNDGIIDLKFSDETLYSEKNQINVYSTTGQKVYSTSISTNTSQINLSELNSGIYIIEITSGNNSFTKKLVLN